MRGPLHCAASGCDGCEDCSPVDALYDEVKVLRSALENANGVLFAVASTSLEMHERVRAFAKRGHEEALATLDKLSPIRHDKE